VLTTATTFFGLLSLMFETALPAVPMIPMAISLGFGVLYAATMTLFVVPVGYVILDDLIRARAGAGSRSAAVASHALEAPSKH
jgi:predicted RND superfamily exporter protein